MKREKLIGKAMLRAVVFFLLTCLLFVGLAESATQPAKISKPRHGGTLRLAEYTDGTSIGFPAKMLPNVSQRQVAPAVEPLFRTDKTGKPVPWLVLSEKSDVKNKAITLTLRKGIKFHDGTDFNAEAVKWNLDACMAARLGSTVKFKSIDVVDDYTVRINLTEWDNTVIGNLSTPLGMMVSPTACRKNGDEWCASHPVGTGPFEFVSWEKDTRTVFKKFNGYWQKGKPYLDRIEWTPINDSLTRQMSFRKGEIDLALSMAPKDLKDFEKDGYTVVRRRVGSGVYSLLPDSVNPNSPFAKLKVRQAAQHAIDGEAIAKSIFYGETEAANQWIYKGHWAYDPSIKGYPYNPKKAKQLLAEAGYPNGFKTKITYISVPENDMLYAAAQGYFKAVGIDADLAPVTLAKWSELATQGGSWEGFIHASVLPTPDTAAALAIRYSGGKSFSQMIVPDDYLDAIRKATSASNFNEKQKWTREAMKLMVDKYALRVVFCSRSDFAISQRYVHNHGFLDTPDSAWWTPEEAWLEK
jgi:peptide/nickel transport system substrate-binding protein